jgi:uncharacterized membrane protein
MVERKRRDRLTRVRFAVEVDAPPGRVWAVTSDPRNLPHWDRHIESVEVPDGATGPGFRYRVRLRLMAVRVTVAAETLSWEPPHRAEVRLAGALLDALVATTIDPLDGDRSLLAHEVAYRFRGPLGGLGAASLNAVGGAAIALRHGTLAQKREAESGS